ncbi:MAG: DUF2993 domain-containing protein [Actinomycetota bacterium]
MRRRRWRWVAVGLVLAVGLYFVADVVLLQYLESRGAAEMARTLSAEDATVELGGAPFIPSFIRGELSDVSVRIRGATAPGGLRIQAIETRFDDVSFEPGKLYALARSNFATRSEVTGRQPVAQIVLVEDDVEEFVRRQIPLVGDVHVKASGVEVSFLKDPDLIGEPNPDEKALTKPARFLPVIRDREFLLDLTSVSQLDPAFRADAARIEELVDLRPGPDVPEGLSTNVSMRNGAIVIDAQGSEVKLTVGEGNE